MIKRVILLNFYHNLYIPYIIKKGDILSSEEMGIPATMGERTIIFSFKILKYALSESRNR